MLRLFTGGYAKDTMDAIFSQIEKSVDNNEDIIILIPDQFSFEYDKHLYKFLGAEKFNKLNVISFKNLAENILHRYGTSMGEYADDNTKQLIMYLAIKKIKADKKAIFYKKQIEKPEFISKALDIVKDFRHSEITPEILEGSKTSLGGALGEKINDLTYLYSTYCEMLQKNGYKDALTTVCEAAKTSKTNGFFKGKTIFVDKFSNFTEDEFSLLDSIFSSAKSLNFALTMGNSDNAKSSISPFVNVQKTQIKLIDKAKEYSHSLEQITVEKTNTRTKPLYHISENIFNPLKNHCENTNDIKIIPANDMYQECEYVSATIKKMICECGYKYNDFAIVSRHVSDYLSILPSTFERYEIPYFMDTRKPVSQKALILYIMSVLKSAATRKFKTENILTFLKSTLSGFSDVDVSMLEDYCFKWNVEGDMWLSDFVGKTSEDSDASLIQINKIRTQAIAPLLSFKNASDGKCASQICKALYKLFEELKLPLIMSEKINMSSELLKDDPLCIETAREFKQLWELLTKSVRSIYTVLADEVITLNEFYNILSQLLFNSTIATPPQKLDAVVVASAERSILSETKIVFVIGVNDGKMPCHVKEGGLFTDKDKQALEKLGMKISRNILWKLAEERFTTYQSLSLATKQLYICYPLSDATGEALRPSPIIKQIIDMFEPAISQPAWEKDRSFYCVNYQSTFYKYCEEFSENTSQKLSLEKILLENNEYKTKIEYLKNAKNKQVFSISKTSSKDMFFENNLNISATKVENYYKCPFSFFCSNGLKLYTNQSIKIDPLNRGKIVHFCLEKIMSKDVDGIAIYNNDFVNKSPDDIEKEILTLLKQYKNKELGGDFGKTNQFEAMLSMLVSLIKDVVINIQNELSTSVFTPHEFEYNISTSRDKSMLELDMEDNTKILLRGNIDRVDIFEKNGKKFVCVVDYKTGAKELSYADLYHGVNMQMLLYLMAYTNGKKEEFPIGLLYMPARFSKPKEVNRYANDDIDKNDEKDKEFKRNGLIISEDERFIENMKNSNFVHIKQKNKNVINNDMYKNLEDFAKEKLLNMAQNLKEGEIPAIPLTEKQSSPCDYCDYWSICGKNEGDKVTLIEKSDGDKLEAILLNKNEEE